MSDRINLKEANSENTPPGDKRQYFPHILEWECPDCGAEQTVDFRGGGRNGRYLSYPEWGEEYREPLLCNECDHVEPVEEAVLIPRITLELVGLGDPDE